ncbi:protein KAKU4-like [Apium graveolens]|uniref:protein KAKU4-like n=1 Tax=Apium graveolens TaxID=4045 RepID=UPI003D792566
MKLFTFMTDTNSISDNDDSEDEDDVASCDDDIPFKKDNTTTEINNGEEPQLSVKSPNWVIEKLLLQETFSREESNKLIEIIRSRVVDCSTMEEGKGAGLMETPSRSYDTPDRCGKAVMEAKYWLEEKKTGSSSKSDMLAQINKGSPVGVAKSYMQARPPWASPSLRNSGSRTPSPMVIDHFKDEKLSSVDGSSFSSAQKRGTLSAGSWTIQDEIRKVRSKATEEMLRIPSSRIDLSSFTSDHKKSQSSVVPDDSSDKVNVSKSLPEIEPLDASVDLVVGSCTIHDSKGSALGMKKDHLQAEQFSTIPDTSILLWAPPLILTSQSVWSI